MSDLHDHPDTRAPTIAEPPETRPPAPLLLTPEQVDGLYSDIMSDVLLRDDIRDLIAAYRVLYKAVGALTFIGYDYVATEIQESAENTDHPNQREGLEKEAAAWRALAAIRREMEDGE